MLLVRKDAVLVAQRLNIHFMVIALFARSRRFVILAFGCIGASGARFFYGFFCHASARAAYVLVKQTKTTIKRSTKESAMKKIIASLFVALSLSVVAVPFADAGRQNGPGKDTTICQAYGSVTYNITFWGG